MLEAKPLFLASGRCIATGNVFEHVPTSSVQRSGRLSSFPGRLLPSIEPLPCPCMFEARARSILKWWCGGGGRKTVAATCTHAKRYCELSATYQALSY